MQELANDPDIAQVMTQFTMDMDTPPEQASADSWTPERQVAAQEKGSWKGVDETVKDPTDQTEDPADTAQPAYPEYQDNLADILKNAGVDDTVIRAAPDYELELKEEQSEASFAMRAAAKDFAKKWSDRYPGNPNETAAKNENDYERFADAFVKNILQRHGEEATSQSIEKGRSDFDYYVNQEFEMAETANPGVTPADIDGTAEETLDEGQCNMTEAGESCPIHGMMECGMEESALAGQYGHSGKMKEVSKDVSFLDRLKELSGMMRK
jgi:hypothetical protein